MAIWQYQFLLIPQNDLYELGAVYHLPMEDYENFSFWKKGDYSISYFEQLTNALPVGKSGNEDIALFGPADGTCIEISLTSGKISEVSVSIDYRSDSAGFLNSLIQFCNQNSIALVDEENDIRQLDAGVILFAMQNSPQAKKLSDLPNKSNT